MTRIKWTKSLSLTILGSLLCFVFPASPSAESHGAQKGAEIPFKLRFLGRTTPGDSYGHEFERLVRTKPWCDYAGGVGKAAVESALQLADGDWQAFAPMLAILSSQHETQYSRLFRS